jgi:hypothetical protein
MTPWRHGIFTERRDLTPLVVALVLLGAALLAGDLLGLPLGWPGEGGTSLALPMAAVAAVWTGATILLYGLKPYPAAVAVAYPAWPAAGNRPVPL